MGPDFYAILGVAPGSDAVVIRAAYKALMFKFHPDRNRAPEAERRARAINEAFTVLGDPRRRATYDAQRAADIRARQAPPRPAPPPRPANGHPWSQAAAAAMRGGPPARAPWRRLAQLRMPPWLTRRAVATTGGAIGLALVIHVATVAFAPAGLFMSAASARAGTVDTTDDGYDGVPANVPPTEVSYDDIEQGAAAFTHAFKGGGMAAARTESQRCHADIAAHPDWRAADRCIAFDVAANAYDDALAESGGGRGDTYFLFVGRNPTALYHALSGDEIMLEMRSTRILQAALPALQQAMWPSDRKVARSTGAAGPRPGYWTNKRATP